MFKTLRSKLLFGTIISVVVINIIFTIFIAIFLENTLRNDVIKEITNIKSFSINTINQNEIIGESKWKSLNSIKELTNSYVSMINDKGEINEFVSVLISEEEINGFLAYALSKYEINMDSNIIIDGIYTDINPETNFAKLYIPITYNKVSLGLTGTLDIHLNESSSKIDINLSNTKVGKLPIPSKLVAKFIAERFPEKITYNNTTISFDSNINFYFKEDNIALEITECEIKNKALAVRTKGVNNVVDKFIKDKFGISISNDSVINSWIDGISNLLVG